jgi:hypothetical protein
MAKTYTFTARIADGRLTIGLRVLQVLRQALTDWRNCPVTVTIERQHATRSMSQNDLYWAAYVTPVSQHTGIPPKQLHRVWKKAFLPKERIEIVDRRTGVVIEDVELEALTTTTLTTIEFSAYLDEIEAWVLDTFHGAVVVGSHRKDAA